MNAVPLVQPLWRILSLWRGRVFWLGLGIVISLAFVGCAIALLTVSGARITTAVAAATLAAPMALRSLGIGRVVLRYLERLATHWATFLALADLRVWFFRQLARGSAGGLGFRRAGDVLARLVGDVDALDGLYLRILVPLAAAIMLLPVLVVLIAPRSIPLACVIAVLFMLAAFLLPVIAAGMTAATGARAAQAFGALRVAALDTLTGLREVRAFGAEHRMLAAVQGREGNLLAAQSELSRLASFATAGSFLCGQAAVLAVLIAAGGQPGLLVAVFMVIASFEAIGGLPRAGALAGHAAGAAVRVLAAAEQGAAVPDPPRVAPIPSGTGLRFEAVGFRWRQDRAPVFDGLSLDVPAGSRVAVLGPSGSGKSTLAALALKVAAPQSGRVTLGGADLQTLAAADVRSRIGWLSQATHLFDDTIRANLLLTRPDADDTSLWAALAAAQMDAVVRALPDGLDTWVGEGGARFSGGQGRRLALARTLLSAAPVLILDEPCAGLDGETERAFLATLNDVATDRSIILITHRLTGVERLDRIWRLSAGRAVAAAA